MVLLYVGILVVMIWVLFWLPGTHRMRAPQFNRCNRSCQRFLFRVLWNEGYFPDVSYRIGKYEVDLAFPYSKIAIECGWNDWERTDLERARSKKKEKLLKEQGWKFITLSPKEIYGKPKLCISKIEQCITMEKHIF